MVFHFILVVKASSTILAATICPVSCCYKYANLSSALPFSSVGAVEAHWHFSWCYMSCMVNLCLLDYQIALNQEKAMFLFQINLDIEGFLLSSVYLKIHICNYLKSVVA